MGRGLPEYEAVPRPDGGVDLAVTLIRAVGWLARRDLPVRPQDAGPEIATPGAQMRGEHRFEYAVRLLRNPDGSDASDAELVRASADYRYPVRTGPPAALPMAGLEVQGDVACAALKVAEAGDGAILRLYNPARTPAAFDVRWPGPVRVVRLDETPLDAPVPNALRPGEILSLWLAADGPRKDVA
jgi:alpha-mannosidase/mannosylglycerate hydrolase